MRLCKKGIQEFHYFQYEMEEKHESSFFDTFNLLQKRGTTVAWRWKEEEKVQGSQEKAEKANKKDLWVFLWRKNSTPIDYMTLKNLNVKGKFHHKN